MILSPDSDISPRPSPTTTRSDGLILHDGWRLVDAGVLVAALAALDAVIQCEPFADVSPPGTEGFLVYEEVAAARERLARALGVPA